MQLVLGYVDGFARVVPADGSGWPGAILATGYFCYFFLSDDPSTCPVEHSHFDFFIQHSTFSFQKNQLFCCLSISPKNPADNRGRFPKRNQLKEDCSLLQCVHADFL